MCERICSAVIDASVSRHWLHSGFCASCIRTVWIEGVRSVSMRLFFLHLLPLAVGCFQSERFYVHQMAPDYDHLPLMNKVEVFEHALGHTQGDDLAKILWHKSSGSEVRSGVCVSCRSAYGLLLHFQTVGFHCRLCVLSA